MIKKGYLKKEDKSYPQLLKKIKKPPLGLFYKGNFDTNLFNETLAVVGSRKITSYGKIVTENLVDEIASAGITIVSGFMYGVDALSHQTAVNAGGKTIAVLPCGVDVVHPSHQKSLYQKVLQNGFFISEYEDNALPEKWTYPQRNRIVVGIAKAVLIIEAEEKSGTMISADIALKENKPLFAVPGSIFSSTSRGANALIKNGANITTSAKDILHFFKKEGSTINKKQESLSKDENDVLSLLKKEALETDQIARKLKKPVAEINATLSFLEIKGFLKKKGRNYYAI